MDHTDRLDFLKMYKLNMEIYGKKAPPDTVIEQWFEDLFEFSFQVVKQAFDDHRRDTIAGKKPPLPSDIRERCKAKRQTQVAETPKLTKPPLTAEQHAKNKARLAEILKNLKTAKSYPH